MRKVLVLMSTYNGERYIREQIESILGQEGVDVSLLIRDDGSSDSTLDIIHSYMEQNSNVRLYTGGNLGAAQSFLDLLNHADGGDYYSFSDQDDVWDTDKLSAAVKMLQAEPGDGPLLYYSNLRVVDGDLNFKRNAHDKARPSGGKYTALAEAAVAGCTMVFNQYALNLLKGRTPAYCSMHDSWVYLVCMMFGKVIYDGEPHMSYRQHEDNVIGAYQGKKTPALYISKIKELYNNTDESRLRNARALMDSYGDVLSPRDRSKLSKILNYKNSIKDRAILLADFSIHATGLYREIRYLAGVLFKNL